MYTTTVVNILSKQITKAHTCDKFQKGIREIFLSFQGGFSKMYRIHKKILNPDEGGFEILIKSGTVHAAKCYDQPRFSANEKRITFLVKPLQNPRSSHDISTIFSR